MKTRPILFSGPMVRAILAGKTQTRRVIKPQPPDDAEWVEKEGVFVVGHGYMADWIALKHPYGVPGDRLWVRETWGVGCRPCPVNGDRDGIEYRADEAYLRDNDELPLMTVEAPKGFFGNYKKSGWRPAIHMPRWASRITLEITGERVERLQDISIEDAEAEGVRSGIETDPSGAVYKYRPIDEFARLWDSINAKRGFGWDVNPRVRALEFKKCEEAKP